ncbi:hypothetical protein UFOVP610_7 [uncultured Caudovirales phage]|uniref:Uncharacterized protein n=1 Tax=uncultured Caudovirales phage TaxID=2100421 RepID=A0A6J5MYQ0_9CAUD|nr:hypothetical protein UFOVP610_7 [uncultured Caudovirales phage]
MAKNFVDLFEVPYKDELTTSENKLSLPWQKFFRLVQERVNPLGKEVSFNLENNISVAEDVEGLQFNYEKIGGAFVDYLIQRVTTGSGAIEAIEIGRLFLNYNPTSNNWSLYRLTNDKSFERSATILNNQAVAVDVPGLSFNSSSPSLISIEYILQRITTGGGATQLIQSGILHLVRQPSTPSWNLRHIGSPGPDSSITFSVTSGGRIQYTSTNITGTASISKMTYRIKTIGPMTSGTDYIEENDNFADYLSGVQFSITSAGQVQYTSSNFTATESISKLTYRASLLSAKNSLYSTIGAVR